VTTEITVPTDTPAKLTLALYLLPPGICCNCGTSEGLSLANVQLPTADFTGERALSISLPHCQRCLGTALSLPPRLGRTLSFVPLFFVISIPLVAGALHLCGLGFKDSPELALLAMTVLAVAAPFVLFRRRPPKFSEQTSRYQAVRLKPKKSFLGKTVALQFKFTNSEYARLYREALDSEGARAIQDAEGVVILR